MNSEEQCDESVCTSEKMNDHHERRAGVSLVAGNHFHYWNAGLPDGTIDFLLATIVAGASYLCLLLCLAEMTSALPFGGGLYGMARVFMGPYVGFITACCEMLQSIVFTASLIYPAGHDLAMLFGLSRWYALPFWVLLLTLALLVNVVEVKYFWRSNVILVSVVAILFWVLEGKVSPYNWFKFWTKSSIFFDGLVLLPMACSDASEPKKTVPRSFLWAFGIAAFSAVLLIITVGCNAPGVAYFITSKTNALAYGYVKGLYIDPPVARVLSIPGSFATASAFTYVYGNQLRSMAQSGLLPTVLRHCYGPDQIPYVALILGAGLVLACISIIHAMDTNIFWEMLIFGHLGACGIEIILLGCYWQLSKRFTTLQREFSQPFGIYAIFFSLSIYQGYLVSAMLIHPEFYRPIWIFAIYLVLMSVGYFYNVKYFQKFSAQEQEVMFKAYVINDAYIAMSANLSRRKKKGHNLHTNTSHNAPTVSPSPSKSEILSRVAACLSRMPMVQTGWHSVDRLYKAANLSTHNLKKEKIINPDEYSSTVTGETRLFQLQGCKGEEEATTPDLGKNSLFSLSLEVVEYQVRKHPASEYDSKGQYNGSTKYRIAPDYVATEHLPSSIGDIFSDEGIVGESICA
eukprot:scaffold654_cov207-Ochromonas_danica.AAC.50